MDNIYTV